jgi:L-lactate utilization protein LutB
VDHLRVQAALAEMEARDELDDLLERVDKAYRAARQQLTKAEDDTADTAEALRAGARRVLDDLETAIDAARKRFTADQNV